MNDELMTVANRSLADGFRASARPKIGVDIQKYQALLDGSDLSQHQKDDFLRALWSIVVTFIDLGFGVHPLQEVCGQNLNNTSILSKDDLDKIESRELSERLTT